MITGEQLIDAAHAHMDDAVARDLDIEQVLEEFGIEADALRALVRSQMDGLLVAAGSENVIEAFASAFCAGFCQAWACQAALT